MSLFHAFAPHVLAVVVGAGLCLWLVRVGKVRSIVFVLPSYILLFVFLVGLTPDRWLRATPTEDQSGVTVIVLGFGYEMNGTELQAGEANRFLLDWVVENRASSVTTLLVQEGVWVAVDAQTREDLDIRRIHRHDPQVYIDTLDTAVCALQQLEQAGEKKALLVAHDLQLQRVAWDFGRVSQRMCPDCTFVIPDIPDTPYPGNSVHLHTRNEFLYKIVELLISRPRDFLSPISADCKAPQE